MKKTAIILLIVVLSATNTYSQYGEYRYFSFKGGMTHCLFNPQPNANINKFVNTPIGEMQLIPDTSYFGYVPGYFAGLIFNYDLQNDRTGLMIGASYENIGFENKYHLSIGDRWMIDSYHVNRVSFPVLFKIGRKIYKEQKFIFIGGSYDINLSLYKTESSSWSTNKKKIKLDKSMLVKNNYSVILGINYMFFSAQVDYMFGSYLSKDYEVTLPNQQMSKPFSGYPNGYFIFKTNLNIPINSWTTRKIYEVEVWFRKVFK